MEFVCTTCTCTYTCSIVVLQLFQKQNFSRRAGRAVAIAATAMWWKQSNEFFWEEDDDSSADSKYKLEYESDVNTDVHLFTCVVVQKDERFCIFARELCTYMNMCDSFQ